jgi:hypothetical protein
MGSGFRAESFAWNNTGTSDGGTAVTSSATANTKGSYVQLMASTSFDSAAIMLEINTNFGDTNYLLDIAVGAAGSEQIIFPNLALAFNVGMAESILLPLAIPAGSRIAARCQDNFGGSVVRISGQLFSSAFLNTPPFHSATAYGAVLTTSAGTIADGGATANTKGAWAQLTAATSQAHDGLIVASVKPTQSTVVTADYYQLGDIGIGAAGSEKVLIPDLRGIASRSTSSTFKGALQPSIWCFPQCDIPAGVRLAARQLSSVTVAADRANSYVVYGLN